MVVLEVSRIASLICFVYLVAGPVIGSWWCTLCDLLSSKLLIVFCSLAEFLLSSKTRARRTKRLKRFYCQQESTHYFDVLQSHFSLHLDLLLLLNNTPRTRPQRTQNFRSVDTGNPTRRPVNYQLLWFIVVGQIAINIEVIQGLNMNECSTPGPAANKIIARPHAHSSPSSTATVVGGVAIILA